MGVTDMSEAELQRLYDLLDSVTDESEKAALRHAIYIIETYNHVY
jgi:hemerythrin superfamily protein